MGHLWPNNNWKAHTSNPWVTFKARPPATSSALGLPAVPHSIQRRGARPLQRTEKGRASVKKRPSKRPRDGRRRLFPRRHQYAPRRQPSPAPAHRRAHGLLTRLAWRLLAPLRCLGGRRAARARRRRRGDWQAGGSRGGRRRWTRRALQPPLVLVLRQSRCAAHPSPPRFAAGEQQRRGQRPHDPRRRRRRRLVRHATAQSEPETNDRNLLLHDEKQERLSTRANLLKPPFIQQIIRSQAARHNSPMDRRVEVGNQVPPRFFNRHHRHMGAVGATNAERSPRISEKENEVDGQKYWQTDSVPSRILLARDWNSESGGASEDSNHIADFKKPCALPRNIKLQAQARRHPSLLRRVEEASQVSPRFIHHDTPHRLMRQARSSYNYRQLVGAIDATNGWKFPISSEMEDEVDDPKDWQTAIVASRWSVEGANQVPPRFIRPDKLMQRACFTQNYCPRVGAIDDINEQRVPKGCSKQHSSVTTSKKFDGVPLRKGLTTSAKGSIQTSGGIAIARKNCQGCSKQHSSVTTSNKFDGASLRKGLITSAKGSIQTSGGIAIARKCQGCSKQHSSVTTSNKFDGVPLKKGLMTSAKGSVQSSGGIAIPRKKVAYATTLGGGGGYGDPHPPPFCKCKVCCQRTAFYRLKCCHLVVCDRCGCDCDAEDVEDKL